MIYDSNDLSILFLPDKKINYWQYRDLIAQKRRAINRDGRYLTNSPKRRQKVDEIENKRALGA